MKKIAIVIAISFIGNVAHAQNEGTLTFMNSLAQVTYNNPAIATKYKVSIGLPGSSVAMFYSNNGFAYRDVYSKVNDSVKADLPKLNSALKPHNYITQALQIDLLRIGLQINSKLYVSLNSTAKVYNRIMLPKDMINLFVNGNADLIGRTANLSPKAESVTFLETALGGSYKVDSRLTVGARLKLLKGITNVTTQSASMNLSMTDSYSLTANAGMDVRTSGINNFSQSNFDFGSHIKDYFKNNGFAIDLGATYKVLDRITLGASLIDIGTIKWKNNTYGYTLNPANATYTFSGVDLNKVLNGDKNYQKSIGDSIQNKFKPKEGNISSYSSPIPGKMYLSGMYQVNRNFTAGAVFFAEQFRGRFAPGITLGVNKHFGRIFSAAGSYTVASNSFNNLGLGMSLNLSPVQIYMVGDNLLRMPLSGSDISSFVNSTKFFNARVGLNYVFGWVDKKSRTSVVDPSADDDKGLRRKMYKNYAPQKNKKRR
jgi:hypothetical protein